MPIGIDLDRGVTIRNHLKDGVLFQVFMYKDNPGEFFDIHGNPVDAKIAGEAGFSVDSLRRDRRLREKLAEVEAKARAELEAEESAEDAIPEGETETLEIGERKFLVVKRSRGFYSVADEAGNILSTEKALRKKEVRPWAEVYVEELVSGGQASAGKE